MAGTPRFHGALWPLVCSRVKSRSHISSAVRVLTLEKSCASALRKGARGCILEHFISMPSSTPCGWGMISAGWTATLLLPWQGGSSYNRAFRLCVRCGLVASCCFVLPLVSGGSRKDGNELQVWVDYGCIKIFIHRLFASHKSGFHPCCAGALFSAYGLRFRLAGLRHGKNRMPVNILVAQNHRLFVRVSICTSSACAGLFLPARIEWLWMCRW